MIETKKDKREQFFIVIFWILLIAFLTIYISGKSGYYEYEMHQKTILTEDKIKQFEMDVNAGIDVRLEDYLEETHKNYQNKVSSATLTISEKIGTYTKIGIAKLFSGLTKIIEE